MYNVNASAISSKHMRSQMLKHTTYLGVLAVALLGFTSLVRAEEKGDEENKLKGIKCLFCKMDVSKEASIEYKGAKLYFGCAGCPGAFDKDNAKHVSKANAQLVATKQARQKGCPFSGKPCKSEFTITVAKAEVAFCCSSCMKATEKLGGDAQLEKVFNDKAFKVGFQVIKKEKDKE
jgi:YHS domain-containing protein